MDFPTYWFGLSPQVREAFAAKCERKAFTLYLIAKGHRRPSPKLAVAIEKASGGLVHRSSLLPDLWERAA